MSQEDVLEVLKKSRKPLTRNEIEKRLNISIASIGENLRSLRKHMEVKRIRKEGRGNLEYFYFV